jgi:hypothetical protein
MQAGILLCAGAKQSMKDSWDHVKEAIAREGPKRLQRSPQSHRPLSLT